MPGKKKSRLKQEKKRLRISKANKGKQDECEVESSDDEEVDEREETDVDEEKKSIETNNSSNAEETAGDVEKKLIKANNSQAVDETNNDVENKSIETNTIPTVEEKPHGHQDEKAEVNSVATCHEQSSHVADIDSQQDHLSGDINSENRPIKKEEANSHCNEVESSVDKQDIGSGQTSSSTNIKESSNITSELPKLFTSVANARSNRRMGDAISEMCKVVNFEPSNLAAEEEYLQWILDESISSKTNLSQHLFLCAVLGHLVDIKKRSQSKNMGDDSKETRVINIPEPNEHTKFAFDQLLDCLKFCSEKTKIAPMNFRYLLDSGARTIVLGSSKPGWLTYAAYFRYFLGMEHVVNFEIEKYNYKEKEFECLLPLLIFGVQPIGRAGSHQKSIYRRYLKRILQSAPNDKILFQMSQNKDLVRFFVSSIDREFFFLDFYKESLNNDPENFSKKLATFRELPNNVQRNLYGVIEKYIQEFFDKAEYPLEKDKDAVFNLISELPIEMFVIILERLSKLQVSSKRKLLLQVLDDRRFESNWKQISNIFVRCRICDVWISHTIGSEKESLGLVKANLKAVDDLESCYLVSCDNELIVRLGQKAVGRLISEDPVQIFEALKEFDDYKTPVQDSIMSLIQEMLESNSNLLKNNSVILNFFPARSSSSSSLMGRLLGKFMVTRYSGFELCLMDCALNALKPPDNQTDMDDRVFADVLQYCDVWIKLIGAKGTKWTNKWCAKS